MEIKLEIDTEKMGKAAIKIAVFYGLCCVSQHMELPQLNTANVIALIIIVAILYGPRATTKPSTK